MREEMVDPASDLPETSSNLKERTSNLSGPGGFKTKCPTTSFLTATILIYASGAGITAAAGTRLALHSILV